MIFVLRTFRQSVWILFLSIISSFFLGSLIWFVWWFPAVVLLSGVTPSFLAVWKWSYICLAPLSLVINAVTNIVHYLKLKKRANDWNLYFSRLRAAYIDFRMHKELNWDTWSRDEFLSWLDGKERG